MNQLTGWIAVAVAARVFCADARILLRRIAVASVRLGNAELDQTRRNDQRGARQ
ncbi:hypothetical protein [Streptomyces youssoufiensis]